MTAAVGWATAAICGTTPALFEHGEELMARYAYGDSDLAAERFALVATLFEPTTRVFLEAAARALSALAIDLGCGPAAGAGHRADLRDEPRGADGAGRGRAPAGARRGVGRDRRWPA
jgi:hypothetical protein